MPAKNTSETSKQASLQPNFSHVYVEKGALSYPDTQTVLDRFNKAEVVVVDDYRQVFHRPRQDWRVQKKTRKLILAVKKSDFLYKGSGAAPDFGYEHFYYNSLMLNCLYDCEYCYLQGMYPTANIVMFVNNDDYFRETLEALQEFSPLYLCISYDTDLLAFEDILPYCHRWIRFAAKNPDLVLELRTKSANYHMISDLTPIPNVVLAWTLSPQSVVKRFEQKTPRLKARLLALQNALEDGWKVRLCFDPVLDIPQWKEHYAELLEQVFDTIDAQKLQDISIGSFRMGKEYFRRAKKQRPSQLMYRVLEEADGLVRYPQKTQEEIHTWMQAALRERLPGGQVIVLS